MGEIQAVQEQEQKPTFMEVATIQSVALAAWFEEMDEKVGPLVADANSFEITCHDAMVEAKARISEAKRIAVEAGDKIQPYKDRINDIKDQVLSTEKRFVLPCKEAEKILKGKIGNWLDHLEAERIKEERRLNEIAQKEREKKLNKLNDRMQTLLDKSEDLQGAIDSMERIIQDDAKVLTCEEAEIVRARIEALQAKQKGLMQQVETKQVEAQEVAEPVTVSVQNTQKVAGMSSGQSYKVERILLPTALNRAIADGRIPAGAIKVYDTTLLERLKNAGVDVPGVQFKLVRNIRVSSK